jgi:hypothetical protein
VKVRKARGILGNHKKSSISRGSGTLLRLSKCSQTAKSVFDSDSLDNNIIGSLSDVTWIEV